jgi:hypothetical protein
MGRAWILLLVSACFDPEYDHPRCGPQRDCPDDLTCNAQGICVRPDELPMFKGYDADEGGEIRVEHVQVLDGRTGTRVLAYVYANPGSTKRFPFLTTTGCSDVSRKANWPVATNPMAERSYLDPGGIVVTSHSAPLDVERQPDEGNDILGRRHAANRWFFHASLLDGALLAPGATYDIALKGSPDVPPQTFSGVPFMPADFALTNNVSTVVLEANMPITFTWTVADSTPPEGVHIWFMVAFSGSDGNGPVVICFGPNAGALTVPATFIDIVRAAYPAGGTILRETFTHVVHELVDDMGPTGRRIDLISGWSYSFPFAVL